MIDYCKFHKILWDEVIKYYSKKHIFLYEIEKVKDKKINKIKIQTICKLILKGKLHNVSLYKKIFNQVKNDNYSCFACFVARQINESQILENSTKCKYCPIKNWREKVNKVPCPCAFGNEYKEIYNLTHLIQVEGDLLSKEEKTRVINEIIELCKIVRDLEWKSIK